MDFSQSLTIRILGDSSDFRNELSEVTQQIDLLESRFRQFGASLDSLSEMGSRFSSLSGGIDAARNSLDGLSERLRLFSRTPVTLNVQPALQSLSLLIGMIDAAAARMAALTARAAIPAGLPGMSGGGGMIPALPRLAEGGLVNGPAGVDRVPALLSAGEFVIREPIVRQLGSDFFAAINAGMRDNSAGESAGRGANDSRRAEEAQTSSIANNYHYGGVTIQVRETADLNALVRDLRHQGFHLKNRRG